MDVRSIIGAGLLGFAFATPASAVVVVYTSALSGAAESPPVISAGTGFTTVTTDDVLRTMRVQVNFAGLTGNVTQAHIHCCTATPGAGNVGVASELPSFTGFPLGGTSGTYDRTFDLTLASSFGTGFLNSNGGTPATAFAALAGGLNSGRAYLNVHSTSALSGEIRGFLAPIPEPETYALMLAGLAAVGLAVRRRRAA